MFYIIEFCAGISICESRHICRLLKKIDRMLLAELVGAGRKYLTNMVIYQYITL